LKQKQYEPLSIKDEVILVFAGMKGYLESISVQSIVNFKEFLVNFIGKYQD
jgi:F-type H+-transporting ATPase subunit alpha